MATMLDRLLSADADQAGALLAQSSAEEVVSALGSASDRERRLLTEDDAVRAAIVTGLLARLHEYAVADRLGGLAGTLRIDVVGPAGRLDRHGLVAAAGTLEHLPDHPATAPVEVVLTVDADVLLGLVCGTRNAGLDYLAGRIGIVGDADLALSFGGIFRVPGTTTVAVDPRDLDPVDVAMAIADVRPAHLREVMASGFRTVVLGEIFRRLPDFVDHRKAARAHLSVGFRLLGRGDGGIDRYVVHLVDGEASTEQLDEDDSAAGPRDRRDATITCEAADFLRLATGHLSAVSGVLRGQLKVRGDKAKALQLASCMAIPHAR